MATPQPLQVLLAAHPNLDTLDLTGPIEILSHATSNNSSPAFKLQITALTPTITTGQNLTFHRHLSLSEAYSNLSTYDILIVPGGSTPPILKAKSEPISLIAAFAALNDGKKRMILSVCTGALFLAEAGILKELKATTHPSAYGRLEGYEEVEVLRERYVVNKRDEQGLRVITAGGISAGIDACLWLVGEVVGSGEMERVAELVQHGRREGVVF